MKTRLISILLTNLVICSLHAATNTWIAGSGDWGVATNWSLAAIPGPNDLAVIPAGPAITVTHSSNNDTIIGLQSFQPFVLSGGSLTVTSNNSLMAGSFVISNGATLGATGPGTSFFAGGAMTADDANFNVTGGAMVVLPTLKNFTKECYGAYWNVSGSNSVLNLPALTNLSGTACSSPTIQAEAGGQILLTNVTSIALGPQTFQADGSNSLIDLSGLTNASGVGTYLLLFEASAGGTVRIPNLVFGPTVGVTLYAGGTIPTAQMKSLYELSLLGVTNNFNALTNVVLLSVNQAPMVFPGITNFDDGNVTVTSGGSVTMPNVNNYTKTSCNGNNWNVTGSNSVLNFPMLTNLSGMTCQFPVIQAEAGGRIELTNVVSIVEGPLTIQADGTNSLVDLTNLVTTAGQQTYLLLFEASDGGEVRIPRATGGPLVGVTLNTGGAIPTAQMAMLDTLNLYGVTNNFNALTNLSRLTVNSVTMNFPALASFDDGNVTLNSGAVVTFPVLRNFTKNTCNAPFWTVTGPGSIFSAPALTNLSGQTCNYPVIQAEAGGQILLTSLATVLEAPLTFQADGAGSLVDLSGLTTCAGQNGYLVVFEASSGGEVRIPHLTGGPLLGVTLNPGGIIPTAQLQTLNTLSLGVSNNFDSLTSLASLTLNTGTINFPALTNFDDGNINLSGGAVVTMPAVSNYTKLSCNADKWTVTGVGTVLSLPALTNLSGETCNYPVIQAEAGGQILLTNVASITEGPLTIQADGAGSLVDLTNLANASGQQGYLLAFEASAGGTMRLTHLTNGQAVGLNFAVGGVMDPTNLITFAHGNITMTAGNLALPSLRNMDMTSFNVSGGAALSAPILGNYAAGQDVGPLWVVTGSNSLVSLPAMTNMSGDLAQNAGFGISVNSGGQLLLSNLQSITSGNVSFLASDAGSTVDLRGLSGFILQNGQGSLTAQLGGSILLNSQAFLLANVSITIPAGNPVLPPALIASTNLTLYGQAGHSYLIEQRNTLFPGSPYTILERVPLTNAFEAIAPTPPPNTAYRVTDFVANPPLLDATFDGSQINITLYGGTNLSYQIQYTTNLTRSIAWTNTGVSVTMTNAFKFVPPITPVAPVIYYRAQQL